MNKFLRPLIKAYRGHEIIAVIHAVWFSILIAWGIWLIVQYRALL